MQIEVEYYCDKRGANEWEKRKCLSLTSILLTWRRNIMREKRREMDIELNSKDDVGWWINPQPIFVEM